VVPGEEQSELAHLKSGLLKRISMPRLLHVRIIVTGLVAASVFRAASQAVAQSARQALGATPVVPLTS
jgi:hypothetical protein